MVATHRLASLKRKAQKEGWDHWIRNEADERALLAGCRFNEARGQHVVDFFASYLTHGKQPHTGKPFVPLDWQRDELLLPLFGCERQDEAGNFRS